MNLKELCPHFLKVISLLSLEEEEGDDKDFSLSYCRLKGSSSSFLSREVGRAFCFFQMLWQRTCHGISCLTHIKKRSSFLADDEVDELSSLSFVSLKLKELRLLRLGANSLQFHILALIQSGRGCLHERPYQNTAASFQIDPI